MRNEKNINNQEINLEIFEGCQILEMFETVFNGCTFNNVSFKGANITSVVFEECRFNNCNFDMAIITKTKIVNSRMYQTTFKDSIIFKLFMKDNLVDYCNFESSIIYESYIRGNKINRTSFSNSRFGFEYEDRKRFPVKEQTEFIENQMENCKFLKTFARGCDFSSNDFYKCQIHEMDLSFATIDYSKFVNTIMKYLIRENTSNQGVDAFMLQSEK